MKLAVVILNSFFLSNNNACFAFQSSTTTGRWLHLPCGVCSTSTTLNRAHREGHDISDAIVPDDVVSRRSILSIGAAAVLPFLAANPRPSFAIAGGAAVSAARVESWPGIQSLEPLYEFKLSVDAIVVGVQDPNNWKFIQKRLDKFFKGFIINEKNYYIGVGSKYMNEIQYDKGELPNYVALDKEARFEALENTMKNLESLKLALADSGNNNADTVEDLAKSSQSSLQLFFAMIPDQDVKAVEELFVHVQKADINGDGRLSDDEITSLSPIEQEIWKLRIDNY